MQGVKSTGTRRTFLPGMTQALTFLPPTKEEAEEATRLWIDEIVVKHNLCPYAEKSEHEIVVVTEEEGGSHDERKQIIFHHIDELEKCTKPKSTTLLVFPFVETSTFHSLYFDVIEDRREQVGSVYDFDPVSISMTIQAVPFSPPMIFADLPPMAQIQGNSPWNTIQLLKYSDLQKVRGYDNNLGERIRLRNMDYIEKNWTPEDQTQLIIRCRMKATKTLKEKAALQKTQTVTKNTKKTNKSKKK
jgi:hypothetical protein